MISSFSISFSFSFVTLPPLLSFFFLPSLFSFCFFFFDYILYSRVSLSLSLSESSFFRFLSFYYSSFLLNTNLSFLYVETLLNLATPFSHISKSASDLPCFTLMKSYQTIFLSFFPFPFLSFPFLSFQFYFTSLFALCVSPPLYFLDFLLYFSDFLLHFPLFLIFLSLLLHHHPRHLLLLPLLRLLLHRPLLALHPQTVSFCKPLSLL